MYITMKMYHAIFIFVLLQYFSCTEPISPPVKPPENKDTTEVLRIDTIWTKIIPSDRAEIISRRSITPIIRGNKVTVSCYDILSTEFEVVSCFDKTNGNILWSWKDYHPDQYGEPINNHFNRNFIIQNNKLLLPAEDGNYVIDLESGSTLDAFYFGHEKWDSNAGFSSFNDLLFRTFWPRSIGDGSKLCVSTIDNLNLTDVFIIDSSENYLPDLCHPTITQNNKGDLLIITPIRYASTDYRKEKGEVFCYNYTTKNVMWHLKDFLDNNIEPNLFSYIWNNNFYFSSGTTVHCLDIETGKINWSNNLIGNTGGIVDKSALYEGKLYINHSNGDITCMDANTGQILWQNSSPKVASSSDLLMTNEYIFQCDKRLCILDRNDGKLLKIYNSPKANSIYNDTYIENLTIDSSTGLLYFTDGYFLICAKLTKS